MALSTGQLQSIQIAVKTSSVLSFFATLVVLTHHLSDPRRRLALPFNRIVLSLILSDFFKSIADFIAGWGYSLGSKSLCQFQAGMIQYFSLSSFIWNGLLAFHLLTTLRRVGKISTVREYIYHIAGWGVPIVPTSLLCFNIIATTDKNGAVVPIMGNASLWCWITTPYGFYRMAFFFGPMWIIMLFNLFAFGYLSLVLRNSAKRLQQFSRHRSNIAPGGSELKTKIVAVFDRKNRDLESCDPRISSGHFGRSSAGSQKSTARNGRRSLSRELNIKAILYLLGFFITWIWGSINHIQNIVSPN
ncbi:hypothetical protein BKA69DRAFT_1090448, partial [Paraphysoderma sedebokerense]